jgi:DNA-binding transcriptional ArsR family regulator
MPKRQPDLRLRPAALRLHEEALLFAALGDETRLALLRQLAEAGPASISTLAHNFRVSRQAVTKHLQFLALASIIRGKRAGREHVWTLNPERLAEAQRSLGIIARGWDDALGRLKAHLEDEA